MDENGITFPVDRARTLLDLLAPESELISATVAEGSFSNFTHVLTAQRKDGSRYRAVVRRYKVFGNYDRGEKARREFKTFELLKRHRVPAPKTLLLDVSGDILGLPGIVVSFVEGRLRLDAPDDPFDWARKLARTLADIHLIPCGEKEQEFLLQGNQEASWFLNSPGPPPYMQAYPGGSELWADLQKEILKAKLVPPVLLHIDYWSGNILWNENEISAVIDWEEAAYGDPAIDVGYAVMNMALMGLSEAGDEFLRAYESITARTLQNLGFWELAAAVRPMIDPLDWQIDRSPGKERFRNFIEQAKKKI